MWTDRPRNWAPYLVAVTAVSAGFVLALLCQPELDAWPALFLAPAVLFSAWYGAFWPALLSLMLAQIARHCLSLTAKAPVSGLDMGLNLAACALVAYLGLRWVAARRKKGSAPEPEKGANAPADEHSKLKAVYRKREDECLHMIVLLEQEKAGLEQQLKAALAQRAELEKQLQAAGEKTVPPQAPQPMPAAVPAEGTGALNRLSRLYDANILPLFYCDEWGNVTESNIAFLDLVHYTRDELLAGKVRLNDLTPPEYAHLDERAFKSAKTSGACAPYEKQFVREDGARLPVLIAFALLEGSHSEYLGFALDLSATKNLEEQLRRRTERLAEANRTRDLFLPVLFHEVRTSLLSLLDWVKQVRSHKWEEVASRGRLDHLEQETRTQVRRMEELLDVSRVLSGRLNLDLRVLDLNTVFQAALDAVRPAADAKGVGFEPRGSERPALVRGDGARLRQVFYNLLANAVKFTPKGGRVVARLELAGPQCVVSVSDTGVGLEPDVAPHLFERFRPADALNTSAPQGLGLGLAVVRHLVELHGGTVEVTSPGVGQGTTFVVRLKTADEAGKPGKPVSAEVA